MRDFIQDDSAVAGVILLAVGAAGILGLFIGWLLWRGRHSSVRPQRRPRSDRRVGNYLGPVIGP
jgi:uncharacterized iron-regulated membrane protein